MATYGQPPQAPQPMAPPKPPAMAQAAPIKSMYAPRQPPGVLAQAAQIAPPASAAGTRGGSPAMWKQNAYQAATPQGQAVQRDQMLTAAAERDRAMAMPPVIPADLGRRLAAQGYGRPAAAPPVR